MLILMVEFNGVIFVVCADDDIFTGLYVQDCVDCNILSNITQNSSKLFFFIKTKFTLEFNVPLTTFTATY